MLVGQDRYATGGAIGSYSLTGEIGEDHLRGGIMILGPGLVRHVLLRHGCRYKMLWFFVLLVCLRAIKHYILCETRLSCIVCVEGHYGPKSTICSVARRMLLCRAGWTGELTADHGRPGRKTQPVRRPGITRNRQTERDA